MTATTHPPMSVSGPTLFVAFELGKTDWKLALTSGFGVAPWMWTVRSGDLGGVERAWRDGRRRLGLPATARQRPHHASLSTYAVVRSARTVHSVIENSHRLDDARWV